MLLCGNLILESSVDNFEDWSKITSQNYILENALVSNPGAIRTGRVWSIARAVQRSAAHSYSAATVARRHRHRLFPDSPLK
jgi:hypothetical protein